MTFALNKIPAPAPGKTSRLVVDHGFYSRGSGEQFPLTMRPGVVLEGLGGGTVGLYGAGSSTQDVLVEFPRGTVFGPETQLKGMLLCCAGIGVKISGGTSTMASSPVVEGVNTFNCGIGISVGVSGDKAAPTFIRCKAVQNVLDGIRLEATSEGEIVAGFQECWFLTNDQTGFSLNASGGSLIDLKADDSVVQHNGRRLFPSIGAALLAGSRGKITTRFRNMVVAHHEVGLYVKNDGGDGIFNRFLHVTASKNGYGLFTDAAGEPAPRSEVINSIFWGNATADMVGVQKGEVQFTNFTTALVNRLGFKPPSPGVDGNMDVDPQFIAAAAGDFRVKPGSPVVDRATVSVVDLPDLDIDKDLRVIDGDGDGLADPDMGADERTTLWLAGPPRIRIGVALDMKVPTNAGYTYIGALSMGSKPGFRLSAAEPRMIPLNPDWLFVSTVYGLPPVATGFFGLLDANASARLQINIPNEPLIVGMTIHAAAVTARNTSTGLHHITNPVKITFMN